MIRARGLTKRFGEKRVLEKLDLELPRAASLLVTGPNGSGKTTLLRLLAGLAAPTTGELEVDAPRGAIGYLGHEPLVYRELTPLENLDLYGRLYRLPERRERIGMLLERFGLWEVRHERVATFSRGMQQRLALCRTFLHEPQLLLLDEPFDGLDAEGAELLHRELARAAGDARSSSTHDPERVERARHGTARAALAERLLRRRRRARAEGPAARAAVARHAAGDAALRRLGARRSSTSRSPPAPASRAATGCSGSRSSSRRSSA